jgi:Ni/Fe-hydrogenase subunit HybB-like protein
MLNWFSAIILARRVPAGATYFPHWIEWTTQIGVPTASAIVLMSAARFLPLFPEPRAETIFRGK